MPYTPYMPPTPPLAQTGPATTPARTRATRAVPEGLFHLVLLDDSDHTYAYVIEMLGAIFGYGVEKAYAIASVVDGEGRATVETAGYAQVVAHQSRIHAYGADPRLPQSHGSMSAIVEAANTAPR